MRILRAFPLITGKSLLLKEGSIREAENVEKRRQDLESDNACKGIHKINVYFISLVATSVRGHPEKEHFLYDVATEMELQGLRIKFLSTKEIKAFYRKHHPDFAEDEVTIYIMALFFIQMNKGSSFFFDEVPFIEINNDSKLM